MTDYTYRILKALVGNKGQVGIDTLMAQLTEGVPDNELTEERRKLASTLINMKSGDNPSIKADFAMVNSGLGKYLDVRRAWQDVDDEKDLEKVYLLSAGRIELASLKELYDPTPQIQPVTNNNTVHLTGDNYGSIVQDSEFRDLNSRHISDAINNNSNTGQTKSNISFWQAVIWIITGTAAIVGIYKFFTQGK